MYSVHCILYSLHCTVYSFPLPPSPHLDPLPHLLDADVCAIAQSVDSRTLIGLARSRNAPIGLFRENGKLKVTKVQLYKVLKHLNCFVSSFETIHFNSSFVPFMILMVNAGFPPNPRYPQLRSILVKRSTKTNSTLLYADRSTKSNPSLLLVKRSTKSPPSPPRMPFSKICRHCFVECRLRSVRNVQIS